MEWNRLATALLSCGFLAGCVTEEIRHEKPLKSTRFRWPVPVVSSGIYHGVNFHLEVDPAKDLSREELRWMEREGEKDRISVQLIPLAWRTEGAREVFSYKDIHRIEFYNKMFHVGKARYLSHQRASLYVFKKRAGDFTFSFRNQELIVPSKRKWIPSVYYYSKDYLPDGAVEGPRARRYTREVLQVGRTTIETVPEAGSWLVNGKRYYPDAGKPLVLHGAAR